MKLKTHSVLGSALLLLVVACSGSDGAAGPAGAAGAPGDPGKPAPTASLVSPSQGILDRDLEVQIGGAGTTFGANDKPDFGAGIQLTDVTVASPTLLVAHIKIGKDAALGKHDVKIGAVTATGAFTVIPAIDVKSQTSPTVTVAQGGVVQFDITNNDTKAFDPNAFKLEANGIIDLGTSASGPQAATGFVLAAPLAQPAKGQVVVSNLDQKGNPRLSFVSDPTALEVTANPAKALAFGAPATQTFAGDLATILYKVSAAAGTSILDFRMEVTDANSATQPYLLLFGGAAKTDADQLTIAGPPSSLFGPEPPPYDIHAVMPVLAGGTDYYVILLDLGKQAGSTMKLTPTTTTATKIAEAAAHDVGAPQALGALPATDGQVVDAELKAGEVDVYKVTGAVADKVQIALSSAADLDVVITKDPAVLADPDGTPVANQKVYAEIFPGVKAAGNTIVTLTGQADVYVVVKADTQGKVAAGKYALSARKTP